MITKIDNPDNILDSSSITQSPIFKLEHENELIDHFSSNNDDDSKKLYYNKEIALKTVLFTMLFYICNSALLRVILTKFQWIVLIGVEFIQSIIFAILYYIISYSI